MALMITTLLLFIQRGFGEIYTFRMNGYVHPNNLILTEPIIAKLFGYNVLWVYYCACIKDKILLLENTDDD